MAVAGRRDDDGHVSVCSRSACRHGAEFSDASIDAPIIPADRGATPCCDLLAGVPTPHTHTRRQRGKSDPIDAEMAARLALAGKATTIPKQTDGIVESIRLLRVTRAGAVKARSAAMRQLSEVIITALQQLPEQLNARKTIRGKAALCRRPATVPQ